MPENEQPAAYDPRPATVEPALRTGAALLLAALLVSTQTPRFASLETDQRTAFLLAAAAALITLAVNPATPAQPRTLLRRPAPPPALTMIAAVAAAVWMAADMAVQ